MLNLGSNLWEKLFYKGKSRVSKSWTVRILKEFFRGPEELIFGKELNSSSEKFPEEFNPSPEKLF